jgi:hypothetical protein
MAKIIDPDNLNVGTEIVFDHVGKTIQLVQAGNLGVEGVTLQAVYSKCVDLWATSAYNKYPMPMYAIDARSGQFQFGTDGQNFNGYKPYDTTTRNLIRDGGWSEYSAAGALSRVYCGIITLGSVGSSDQLYYRRATSGAPINFVYTGPLNEAVQVFGDATNGNFDDRSYFKVFCRIQGKTYAESTLTDIGESSTGAFKLAFPISNAADPKVTVSDNTIDTTAPYTSMSITYYGTDQNRTIGGTAYPYRRIIAAASATAEQIYQWAQRQLRKATNIDTGNSVVGQTADLLLTFVGDRLDTSRGVFTDDFNAADTNRIRFQDQNAVFRTYPYTASGILVSNSFLIGGVYRMWFATTSGGQDWGTANAITVKDSALADIAGTISSDSIPFSFDYDTNVQGGRTAGTDAPVVVMAVYPGSGKVTKVTYTLTRAVGQTITLTAEQDRPYNNP